LDGSFADPLVALKQSLADLQEVTPEYEQIMYEGSFGSNFIPKIIDNSAKNYRYKL